MKEFLKVLRRFVPPYKKYLVLSIVFNILSAVLNIFSFTAIIPILKILFKVGDNSHATQLMAWGSGSLKDVMSNNADYYIQQLINSCGATTTLLLIGLFLAVMTFLKTGAYFLSSASIIPIRTGVVRDIRNQLYQKITSLHLGFFSEERKGDIIARMSGDVQEIENSIMSSLDMLFKNPILILFYFATLVFISWQLTLFTLIFVPVFGWFMGFVGRKLKQKSIKAQALWSDTMSQVEETLGGLRIIKAFNAEDKMNRRFDKVNSDYRNSIMKVNIRQQMAHPMSEFLGTVMIIIVLWVGGMLVLNNHTLTGPKFIYYLVMLYSIINPLKEFSKAGYNIPKGLASMDRIDKILKAEIAIKETNVPRHITTFEHQIEFRDVSFRYGEQWVLRHINLVIPKGKTIALVGQSGSGKSTLMHCAAGLDTPTEGRVVIGQVDATSLNDKALTLLRRRRIGFIFQSFNLLPTMSARENILLPLKLAHVKPDEEWFTTIVTVLGLTERLGHRPGELSGGQAQRVAAARALITRPDVIFADEPTASLDPDNRRIVTGLLERAAKAGACVVIATHDDALASRADVVHSLASARA